MNPTGSANSGFQAGLWDLFSNFEFLNKKRINISNRDEMGRYVEDMSSIEGEYDTNALSYLRDNECLDIIHENKINQQTCYWRLLENENQIFNFYKGLNYDIYEEDDSTPPQNILVGNNDGMFDKTPMMSTDSINPGLFTCNWVNFYKCDIDTAYKLSPGAGNMNTYYFNSFVQKYYTKVTITPDTKILWIGLLKFDLTKLKGGASKILGNDTENTFYFATINCDGGQSTIMRYGDDADYIIGIRKGVLNMVDETYKLTLKYFLEHPEDLIDDADILEKIQKLIQCIVLPEKVLIKRTLQCKMTPGPTPFTTEFRYVKDNECLVQLYRYGGNLYPLFIKVTPDIPTGYHNFQYWVKQYNDYYEFPEEYINNLQTKYKPTYPSIGYDSLNRIEVIPYYKYTAHAYNSETGYGDYKLVPEYQWFQASMIKKLHPSIIVKKQYESGIQPDMEDIIKDFTMESFNEAGDNLIEYVKKYIIGLYDMKIQLESNPEVTDDGLKIMNTYTITFTLK